MSVFFLCPFFSFLCNRQLPRVLGCVLTRHNSAPAAPPRLLAAQHVVCFYLSLLTPLSDEEIIHYHASIDLLHLLPLWQRPPQPPPRHFTGAFKTPPQQIWKCSTATKGINTSAAKGEFNFWKQHLPAKADFQCEIGGWQCRRLIRDAWVTSVFRKGNFPRRAQSGPGLLIRCFIGSVCLLCVEVPLRHQLWHDKA